MFLTVVLLVEVILVFFDDLHGGSTRESSGGTRRGGSASKIVSIVGAEGKIEEIALWREINNSGESVSSDGNFAVS